MTELQMIYASLDEIMAQEDKYAVRHWSGGRTLCWRDILGLTSAFK